MRVVSLQIGSAQTIDLGSRKARTGIHKQPVTEASFEAGGVAGDTVANTRHHGGPDQAVYVYADEDYAWWRDQLGRRLPAGIFGENMTIAAAGADPIRVGDRLRVGETLLEVTAPRIPCSVFAARMGEPDWIRRFRDAGRPGFYCRVLTPGRVQVGDAVTWTAAAPDNLTLSEMVDHFYASQLSPAEIRRALASPVAARSRAAYVKRPAAGR